MQGWGWGREGRAGAEGSFPGWPVPTACQPAALW